MQRFVAGLGVGVTSVKGFTTRYKRDGFRFTETPSLRVRVRRLTTVEDENVVVGVFALPGKHLAVQL